MLYCYDPAATAENWLHDGVTALVTRMLDGDPDPMSDWTAVFPADQRERMSRRDGLESRLVNAAKALASTSASKRASLQRWMAEQNDIPAVFEPGTALMAEPAGCKRAIKALDQVFDFAFKLLTGLGIRDRHYQLVYAKMPKHVCPFCGIEPMTAPHRTIPRTALDHYLASSRYPLAAANLRNLAPAGPLCNAGHKLAKDVVRTDAGRRRCFDPYGGDIAEVSLLRSVPTIGGLRDAIAMPEWRIDYAGEHEQVATWIDVYDIDDRYRHNVLDAEFRGWMDLFASWCARRHLVPMPEEQLLPTMRTYIEDCREEGLAGQSFFRAAVFEMLEHRIQSEPDGPDVAAWLLLLLSENCGAV